MDFVEITYDDMVPYGTDYRVTLHEPNGKRRYYALKEEDEIVACTEVESTRTSMRFHCVFVPERFRGNGYAYDLIMNILFENQDKSASAQANNWSVNTFLKAGFKINGVRKCRY